MISTTPAQFDPTTRDRLLVVGDRLGGGVWIDELRTQYPEWTVTACDSYLAGIAELSKSSTRAVLACVDSGLAQLGRAVAGLRTAAGVDSKVVLYCVPELEPLARQVVAQGADDYLLFPVVSGELDTAIGYTRVDISSMPHLTVVPGASMEELAQLGEVLSGLSDSPMALLERIAELLCTALSARGAMVVVQGAAATAGEAMTNPVLTAPLTGREGVMGQLSVSQRTQHAYTPGDAEKLKHYATLVSHILGAARRQRQWRQLAATDECSGLPNRRHLHERLDEILVRAAAERFHVTFLLFDVDDFKTYNDTFGHDAGDEIIRVVGSLFQKHCRAQDVVARYGGDEFAVVFWDSEGPRVAGSKHPDCALGVLERFTAALESHPLPRSGATGSGRLTISGGLATYPWDATTRDDLITRADEALLTAKHAGKNRVVVIGSSDTSLSGEAT